MTAKDKRNRKIKWLRKLYRDAKNAELQGPDGTDAPVEEEYENPFDDEKFMELDDNNFEKEVNNLIEWCEDLDYEKYTENWGKLATSAANHSHQQAIA